MKTILKSVTLATTEFLAMPLKNQEGVSTLENDKIEATTIIFESFISKID